MEFNLEYSINHLVILGAGASMDYGLPSWSDLCLKIKELLESEEGDSYIHKDEILLWIAKVGKGNPYATIDECIAIESISKQYRVNGGDIENQVWILVKDILRKSYKENENAWIGKLNNKFLHTALEHKIAFVNYNYDDVLNKNFLNFDYISQKERRSTHKNRLAELSNTKIATLCPHGTLFPDDEVDYVSHLKRYASTSKSGDKDYVDVVSCHDSGHYSISKENLVSKINLYLLGLGGGMDINLSKVNIVNKVSEIHVTVKDESILLKVLAFLSDRYGIPVDKINVYKDCDELVNKCFSSS